MLLNMHIHGVVIAILKCGEIGVFNKLFFVQKYRVTKLMEESYDYRISPQYTQLMVLNLRPGGTPVETEVLVFDLFDLVGNVGGFLGLFLGASLLTLLDEAKELWDKCREKFKKKPNKRVPSQR